MRRLMVLAATMLALVAAGGVPLAARGTASPMGSCGSLPADEPAAADAGAPPTAPRAAAGELPSPLALMPTEVKIGQMLIAGVAGTALTADARHVIADLHVGNVVLMGPNIDSPTQVLALTRDLQGLAQTANGVGALIATDQEGGLVQRLNSVSGFTPMPDAATVGAARCPAVVRRYGRMVGEELRAVGVNIDFAPVLDVNDNPTNPVIGSLGRSFGTTPELVEESALPFIAGLHDAGVAATGKHFPGHGSTTEDSHKALPYVTKDRDALEAVEIRPFRAAVTRGIDAIMPAHVTYPALDPSGLPATVSAPIQTGLLRGELDFTGVIVTDDMGMEGITQLFPPEEAAVRAVLAGADLVLCVRRDLPGSCPPAMVEQLRSGLLRAVADGRLPMARVDASVGRILALKARYHVGPASGDGLARIRGAEYFRILAAVFDAVAERREEAGSP